MSMFKEKLNQYGYEDKAKWALTCVLYNTTGKTHRHITCLFLTFLSTVWHSTIGGRVVSPGKQGKTDQQEEYYKKMLNDNSSSAVLRLLECFLEAAPQLVLQLYIMMQISSTEDPSKSVASSQTLQCTRYSHHPWRYSSALDRPPSAASVQCRPLALLVGNVNITNAITGNCLRPGRAMVNSKVSTIFW